jgi:hypothetical protein
MFVQVFQQSQALRFFAGAVNDQTPRENASMRVVDSTFSGSGRLRARKHARLGLSCGAVLLMNTLHRGELHFLQGICVAPTALGSVWNAFPALPHRATLCRRYAAACGTFRSTDL